jgi:PAS domain S-box-containing protein
MSEPSKPPDTMLKELEGEQIFRLLVSGVKDYAIFMLDPKGYVMTWNEGARRIKGYCADEIIGKHFSLFYLEKDKAIGHPEKELEIAQQEGSYEEEGWRVRKDGSNFWASVVITAIYESDRLVGYAKVTKDLTEKKIAYEKLIEARRREEVFRLLVSGVKDYAIFMLDPKGFVMTWNDGAEHIKGYKAEEIIGKHFSQFYTEDAKQIAHPAKELDIAEQTGRYEEEGWRVRKDGSTFWANVVITAIREDGKLIGFAKVTRDLTERRQTQQQREADARALEQSSKELQRALEVKSLFLSTISHEVRTPLSGIIGMSELLTLRDLGPDGNDIARIIFDSSKRLLQLLNDLLDTSRMESGKLSLEFRRFPVRAVIGDVRQLIRAEANKKKLQIAGTCEAPVPEFLCGDEFRLRQVLSNLAFNAVKFTASGEISISCAVKEQSNERIILRFSVSDTGIGISAADQLKLFQPFAQAESSITRLYGGSGLGLSISKNLVELMGGQIGVESELGKGSTFWFTLPFNDKLCAV